MDDSRNDLVRASESGKFADVRAILDQPRGVWEGQLGVSLGKAICRRDPELVRLLLSHGAKLDFASFCHLSRMADISLLEALLAHGWDFNSMQFGEAFVRLSVSKPHVLDWLLSHGADPNVTNEKGVSALATAAVKPLEQVRVVIDTLLSHGARMDANILHVCLRPTAKGGPDMLEYFVNKGANAKQVINHVTVNYGTPLHYAAFHKKEKEVQILLDAGADPSIVVNGETPASVATRVGCTSIYKMLIARSGIPAETR